MMTAPLKDWEQYLQVQKLLKEPEKQEPTGMNYTQPASKLLISATSKHLTSVYANSNKLYTFLNTLMPMQSEMSNAVCASLLAEKSSIQVEAFLTQVIKSDKKAAATAIISCYKLPDTVIKELVREFKTGTEFELMYRALKSPASQGLLRYLMADFDSILKHLFRAQPGNAYLLKTISELLKQTVLYPQLLQKRLARMKEKEQFDAFTQKLMTQWFGGIYELKPGSLVNPFVCCVSMYKFKSSDTLQLMLREYGFMNLEDHLGELIKLFIDFGLHPRFDEEDDDESWAVRYNHAKNTLSKLWFELSDSGKLEAAKILFQFLETFVTEYDAMKPNNLHPRIGNVVQLALESIGNLCLGLSRAAVDLSIEPLIKLWQLLSNNSIYFPSTGQYHRIGLSSALGYAMKHLVSSQPNHFIRVFSILATRLEQEIEREIKSREQLLSSADQAFSTSIILAQMIQVSKIHALYVNYDWFNSINYIACTYIRQSLRLVESITTSAGAAPQQNILLYWRRALVFSCVGWNLISALYLLDSYFVSKIINGHFSLVKQLMTKLSKDSKEGAYFFLASREACLSALWSLAVNQRSLLTPEYTGKIVNAIFNTYSSFSLLPSEYENKPYFYSELYEYFQSKSNSSIEHEFLSVHQRPGQYLKTIRRRINAILGVINPSEYQEHHVPLVRDVINCILESEFENSLLSENSFEVFEGNIENDYYAAWLVSGPLKQSHVLDAFRVITSEVVDSLGTHLPRVQKPEVLLLNSSIDLFVHLFTHQDKTYQDILLEQILKSQKTKVTNALVALNLLNSKRPLGLGLKLAETIANYPDHCVLIGQLIGNNSQFNMKTYIDSILSSAKDPATRAASVTVLSYLTKQLGISQTQQQLNTVADIFSSLSIDSNERVRKSALEAFIRLLDSAGFKLCGDDQKFFNLFIQIYDLDECTYLLKIIQSCMNAYGPEMSTRGKTFGQGSWCIVEQMMGDEHSADVTVEILRVINQMLMYKLMIFDVNVIFGYLVKKLMDRNIEVKKASLRVLSFMIMHGTISTDKLESIKELLLLLLNANDSQLQTDAIEILTKLDFKLDFVLKQRPRKKVVIVQINAAQDTKRENEQEEPDADADPDEEKPSQPVKPKQMAAVQTNTIDSLVSEFLDTQIHPTWEVELFNILMISRSLDKIDLKELSQLIKLSFNSANKSIEILRVAGLILMKRVIEKFIDVPDPVFPEVSVLEQYTAQINAGLCLSVNSDTPLGFSQFPLAQAVCLDVCAAYLASKIDLKQQSRVQRLIQMMYERLAAEKAEYDLYPSCFLLVKLSTVSAFSCLMNSTKRNLDQSIPNDILPHLLQVVKEFYKLQQQASAQVVEGASVQTFAARLRWSFQNLLDDEFIECYKNVLLDYYQDTVPSVMSSISKMELGKEYFLLNLSVEWILEYIQNQKTPVSLDLLVNLMKDAEKEVIVEVLPVLERLLYVDESKHDKIMLVVEQMIKARDIFDEEKLYLLLRLLYSMLNFHTKLLSSEKSTAPVAGITKRCIDCLVGMYVIADAQTKPFLFSFVTYPLMILKADVKYMSIIVDQMITVDASLVEKLAASLLEKQELELFCICFSKLPQPPKKLSEQAYMLLKSHLDTSYLVALSKTQLGLKMLSLAISTMPANIDFLRVVTALDKKLRFKVYLALVPKAYYSSTYDKKRVKLLVDLIQADGEAFKYALGFLPQKEVELTIREYLQAQG